MTYPLDAKKPVTASTATYIFRALCIGYHQGTGVRAVAEHIHANFTYLHLFPSPDAHVLSSQAHALVTCACAGTGCIELAGNNIDMESRQHG
eukprot:1155321-Pelagomonas_calceolata.AAC.6